MLTIEWMMPLEQECRRPGQQTVSTLGLPRKQIRAIAGAGMAQAINITTSMPEHRRRSNSATPPENWQSILIVTETLRIQGHAGAQQGLTAHGWPRSV